MKKFTYIYNGSMGEWPMSEEELITHMERTPLPKEDYQLVELVPVKMIHQTGYKLERA